MINIKRTEAEVVALEAELDAQPISREQRSKADFSKVTTRSAFEDARTRNVVGEHKEWKRGQRVRAMCPEGEVEILGEHAPGFVLVGAETENGEVVIYPMPVSRILRRVTAQREAVQDDPELTRG